mmetsp:Transcript_16757/g.25168  ORF Transcript_16757/g.25168 Transcript_16757/m.25168 type:complete len:785 (-) Transcript_16757:204-2558(-)|eukprot:CAMPEP_0185039836 /NCGR_PEP_ID=MMETSP1103-20130426/37153_1 /TAXON_ID=36769 /ORGANISM="Paraphysomonas bandaiensis, Strain Caron Lab Isolate" /LENGTH=784 /DNA_ID=CAMNT_0027578885 /DNA_START=132 /DNA_END=2486 /DNA_ORIENTATION=-
MRSDKIVAHNVFEIDGVVFSSNFDNGNLLHVEKTDRRPHEYRLWSANDNHGSEYESRHCTWFHFSVTGLPHGCTIKLHIMNPNKNTGLYKYDMRPVYKSSATNDKWVRIRSPVRHQRSDESSPLSFEHVVDNTNGAVSFAFTYPYTYTMVQNDLERYADHVNDMTKNDAIFFQRELLTTTPDGLRVDLVTISSTNGASEETEALLPDLFPDSLSPETAPRPPVFPNKEILFISARVHPGEVPAQHTWKGIFDFLMDPNDFRAKALRRRYVVKMVPMLNPDGVYRGHFRMDQFGQNLNRHYLSPCARLQPSIFAVKALLELYAQHMAMYLDLHAHASKRGCFIYGNVLDSMEHQVQNQLFCRLIAMNSAHFDYEGCLFSKEHMQRVDPGDAKSGLTAEGSGRVSTYLNHKIIHSYTLECNYNQSKFQNEVAPTDGDPGGKVVTAPSAYNTHSEKYTPSIYAGVGRACMVAMLDLRGQNPCSRIPKSKVKTLQRIRQAVLGEVRQRSEYRGQVLPSRRRTSASRTPVSDAEVVPWVPRVDCDFKPPDSSKSIGESPATSRKKVLLGVSGSNSSRSGGQTANGGDKGLTLPRFADTPSDQTISRNASRILTTASSNGSLGIVAPQVSPPAPSPRTNVVAVRTTSFDMGICSTSAPGSSRPSPRPPGCDEDPTFSRTPPLSGVNGQLEQGDGPRRGSGSDMTIRVSPAKFKSLPIHHGERPQSKSYNVSGIPRPPTKPDNVASVEISMRSYIPPALTNPPSKLKNQFRSQFGTKIPRKSAPVRGVRQF